MPKHARVCPNCMVPLGEITFKSVAFDALLVVLALVLMVACGWAAYHLALLG